METPKQWEDKSHPQITSYWQKLQSDWIEHYQSDHRNYIKEMFIRLVGNNFYRFLLAYNKRMKYDIDSIPGLSDYIFGDNHLGCSIDSIFFFPKGFELGKLYDDDYVKYEALEYRSEETEKYFNTRTYHYFNDLDSCQEFQFYRKFRFKLTNSEVSRYNRSNSILNNMLLFGNDSYISNLLNGIKISAQHSLMSDGVHEFINICLGDTYFIRFEYQQNTVNNNLPGMKMSLTNDIRMFHDGYSDLGRLTSNTARCVYIKVNRPLFTASMCKLFHVLEKINRYENQFESEYFKNFSNESVETQFLDQIILKCLFIDNETIKEALKCVNDTRPHSYRYIPDSHPVACYMDYIQTDVRNTYDRYNKRGFYNVQLVEHAPMWLDLLYHPLYENAINMHDFGIVCGETAEQTTHRQKNLTYTGNSLIAIIDQCNLRRQDIFENFVKRFNNQ